MSFIQIQDLHTERFAEIEDLAAEWREATAGRSTLRSEQVYVDRTDPSHYVVVAAFDSYESAMVNSALPETDAFAAKLGPLVDGEVGFLDLDQVSATDERAEVAATLRADVERSTATTGAYADDVEFRGMFPNALTHVTGPAALTALLREDAPGHTVETWDVQPTPTGFVAEYAWRTTGSPSYLSVGTVLATVTGGRISRVLCTCAGAWDAAAEAAIVGASS